MDSQQTPQANQQLTIPMEVKNFLESLLNDAGMATVDAEMREEMIKELYVRLDNYFTSTIVNNLPPENMEEFIKMNEEKKPQAEIEQFLKDKIPNAQDIFAKTFMEFRDLYLGNATVKRNAPESNPKNAASEADQIPISDDANQEQIN